MIFVFNSYINIRLPITYGSMAITYGSMAVWQKDKNQAVQIISETSRPSLTTLYGCETWKMNKSNETKLNSIQYQCLKKALQTSSGQTLLALLN